MQDDNNKKSEIGFGRSASVTQSDKKTQSDALHTYQIKTEKKAKTHIFDDISISEALGNEEDLPKVIQRMPKPLRRIWQMIFGGADKNARLIIPRESAGIDRVMLIIICILICIGSVMVFSASYAFAETRYHDSMHFLKKQILFVILGFIAMFITSIFTPDFYKTIARGVYAVSLLLLVAVLVMGFAGNGAQRWLSIGPISFQPSEIAKMSLVLILAWYFSVFGDKVINHRNKKASFFYGIIYPFSLIGITAVLVMLEKHLSCLIILGCIGLIIMFIGGTDKKWMLMICAVGVVAVAAVLLVSDYAMERVTTWLFIEQSDPQGSAWQTLQGLYAIGSGGLFGVGLGNSTQKYGYVSEPQNDFIFTIVCEELGFFGALMVIVLFSLLLWRGYKIASRCPDKFSALVVYGLTTKIALQTILNIAVVTNSMPNTGISLPFFSSGGTALILQIFEMGIILSMSRFSYVKK